MPSPRSLRPIILPSARHLPPIPPCPVIHQHHHRRTKATLRPSTKSQNYASLVGSAIAATFGAALWLRPQHSTNAQKSYALYRQIVEGCIKPSLRKTFQEYLGCQNVQYTPSEALASRFAPEDDVAKVAGIQVGLFLDADAASESLMGSVIGFGLTSTGKEEIELVTLAQEILKDWDRQGLLRREGRAVLLVSCKGVDGIWVYGEEGVEVEDAIDKMELEGGWMSQILSFKRENLPFYLVTGSTQS